MRIATTRSSAVTLIATVRNGAVRATASALLIRLNRMRNTSSGSARTETGPLRSIANAKPSGAVETRRSATCCAADATSTPRRRRGPSASAARASTSLHRLALRDSSEFAASAALAPVGPHSRCRVSRCSPRVASRLRRSWAACTVGGRPKAREFETMASCGMAGIPLMLAFDQTPQPAANAGRLSV